MPKLNLEAKNETQKIIKDYLEKKRQRHPCRQNQQRRPHPKGRENTHQQKDACGLHGLRLKRSAETHRKKRTRRLYSG